VEKQAIPRFTIIEAPSVLGLFPNGVETLPDALLAEGFGERLEARRAGRVEPPQYDNLRDPETALLNPRGIADYSVTLADAVGRTIDVAECAADVTGCCLSMAMPTSIRPTQSRTVRRHLWTLRSPPAAGPLS
jgi:arginase